MTKCNSSYKKYIGYHSFNYCLFFFYLEPPCLEELSVTSKNHEIVIHYVFEVLETSPIVKEIRWAKNELILDLSNEKYRGGRLEDHCITISSPGEDDKGVYTCKVLNAAGHDSKNVKLGWSLYIKVPDP